MSAEPSPCSTSPSTRGTSFAVGGHGVEMAAEHDAPVATELRAHDDVVADAVDGQRRRARRRRASTRSASPASWWLSDGTADQRGR